MQKNMTIRAELLATAARSDLKSSNIARIARDVRSRDVEVVAAALNEVYGAVGRVLRASLGAEFDDQTPRSSRILRMLAARDLHIDPDFVEALAASTHDPVRANEFAVVAGDVIMEIGATDAEATDAYAETGVEIRQDGTGGWEALSPSDLDWQPVQIISISPELADHIRQHGAPSSWDTINGVAHLEREYA